MEMLLIDNGKIYWQRNLCNKNPKRYADGSTKHPIEHLKAHRMSANEHIKEDNTIQQVFGSATPKIHFNLDVFKQLLTQWIVKSNIGFHRVDNCY